MLKTLKSPSTHTTLLVIAALVAVLTWVVPSGKFDTLAYRKDENVFVRTHLQREQILPATQKTLDTLHIKMPLEKFTNGNIWKPISIPGTYQKIPPKPQGIAAFIQSPVKGIIKTADIALLVLFIGGLISIMNYTGAFDAGIHYLTKYLEGKEYLLIVFVTLLISIGGTTFGLAEETIAFYPILIPVFLAAGYDAIVAVGCIFLGSSVGTMCSTTDPFSVIIASDVSGVNWTSGLMGRFVMLLLGTVICILYVLRYANRVKKDPSKSVIYSQKDAIEKCFGNTTYTAIKLTLRMRIVLIIFLMCFVVMIYGVSRLDWWFTEMTTVFFLGAVVIGFIARIKESTFIEIFLKGANSLLGVAIIVGIARGITILMEDGQISDTFLHYASHITQGMSKGLFVNAILYICGGLSFFISSSSGMAVLTMPIMAPLADGVGVGREVIVNAYMYGLGLFSFITPTGMLLPSLAIVKIGYGKWIRFVIPLLLMLMVLTMVALTISVYL